MYVLYISLTFSLFCNDHAVKDTEMRTFVFLPWTGGWNSPRGAPALFHGQSRYDCCSWSARVGLNVACLHFTHSSLTCTPPYQPAPAVALAFEEMRTPYASGREICVQKFGYTYQQKRKTNGAFQKHLYDHQTIQRNTEMWFANDACIPFTIPASFPWSFVSCVVWDVLRLNPAFCVRCTCHFHDLAYS